VIRPNEPVRPERRRGLDAAAEQLRHRRLVLLIVVEVGVDFELWVEDGVPYAVAGDTSRVPDDVHATCFGMLTGASG
jgi:hypothetical protein